MTVTLTPETANEFSDARQQALLEKFFSFFTGRPHDLLSFEEVRQNLKLQDSAYKGLQEIEVAKIVGSVGRYRDFTRTFLPKSDRIEERWRRVDAVSHNWGYPPIEVYKVADVYFVRDGNHRVSVARLHKTKTIEAYIIEYKTPVPIAKDDDLADIAHKMDHYLLETERTRFLKHTYLDKVRPNHQLKFTEPGRYRLLQEHIAFHKYIKEVETGHQIPYQEAVASWYDHVYLPIIESIHQNGVLKDFPGRTETDLYAWLLQHRAKFEHELKALGYVPTEDLIETLKRERATNPFARLMGMFRYGQGIRSLSLKVERHKFLDRTLIADTRPAHAIKFTEAGCYELALRHIEVHKYFIEIENDQDIPYADAAASWYDKVYQPIIQLIREHELAKYFPKNTAGDLYIWVIARREALEDVYQTMGQIPAEQIIRDLKAEIATSPLFTHLFGHKLNLAKIGR